MITKSGRLILLACIMLSLALLSGCSGAGDNQGAEDTGKKTAGAGSVDFPARDITFIVPVSPGGGFDTYARLLAGYWPKYLPKQVHVIVKNVPGGEWNVGIGETNRAKPDGYTVCIFNIPANVLNQLLGADYDLAKMTWIGRITDTVYVGALSPKSKFKTFEDMKKGGEVIVGTVGLSSGAGLGALIAFQEMGIKAKFIPHEGSSEAIMAAVRGDVDYVQYPYPSLREFITDSKQLNPVVVYYSERYGELTDVPTIKELGYGQLLDTVNLEYLVAGPPGIPDDVAEILRDSFQKAVNDPEFIDKMEKAGQPPHPATAEEAAQTIQSSLKAYEKYKELVLEQRK